MNSSPHVAIVGATGAVGLEMLECIVERKLPHAKLTLLASARSAGKKMHVGDEELVVEELTKDSFSGVDIALFSAGGGISREFGPVAAAAGALVIDNSSAFRLDEDVPLVIPEVNPLAASTAPRGIIANPNCTTIVTLMALAPLHRQFGLRSIIASSYQAVSGSGQQGIAELSQQITATVTGDPLVQEVYPRQIAFNVIPHVDVFDEGDYTKEELKMRNESRKILGLPELAVTCTCVRVPVLRSHSVSVTAQFQEAVTPQRARDILAEAPGIIVQDDPNQSSYPTPLDTTGQDDCQVGRIRHDQVLPNALAMWICGDQVRKGAALNAVQIAELLIPAQAS